MCGYRVRVRVYVEWVWPGFGYMPGTHGADPYPYPAGTHSVYPHGCDIPGLLPTDACSFRDENR